MLLRPALRGKREQKISHEGVKDDFVSGSKFSFNDLQNETLKPFASEEKNIIFLPESTIVRVIMKKTADEKKLIWCFELNETSPVELL